MIQKAGKRACFGHVSPPILREDSHFSDSAGFYKELLIESSPSSESAA